MFPIGAFMCKDSCDVLEPGDHGSTFGGNVLTTAAGNATVRYMVENDVPGHARKVGAYLESKLEEMRTSRPDVVKGYRGMGLLIALQLQNPISGAVVAAGNNEGVLLNPVLPDAIRFMPPLIITEADVDECIEKLNRAIDVAVAG